MRKAGPPAVACKVTSTVRAWLLCPSNQRPRSGAASVMASGLAHEVQPGDIRQGIAKPVLLPHQFAGQLIDPAFHMQRD
jgi:hypothetical protein